MTFWGSLMMICSSFPDPKYHSSRARFFLMSWSPSRDDNRCCRCIYYCFAAGLEHQAASMQHTELHELLLYCPHSNSIACRGGLVHRKGGPSGSAWKSPSAYFLAGHHSPSPFLLPSIKIRCSSLSPTNSTLWRTTSLCPKRWRK